MDVMKKQLPKIKSDTHTRLLERWGQLFSMAEQILNNSPSLVCIQTFLDGVCASLYIKHICPPSHVGRRKTLAQDKILATFIRVLMDLVDGGEGV